MCLFNSALNDSEWQWTNNLTTAVHTDLLPCGVFCPLDPPAAIPDVVSRTWNNVTWSEGVSEPVYTCGAGEKGGRETPSSTVL